MGVLATFGAKSDVIFLLGDPDFRQERQNFARISRIPTSDAGQTDDRLGDRNRKLSHCKCASLATTNQQMPFAKMQLLARTSEYITPTVHAVGQVVFCGPTWNVGAPAGDDE